MTAESNPAVLITGASRGLGRHTAVHLADQGFRVFAGVRSPEAAAALDGGAHERVTPVRLDVTDGEQVCAAVAHVAAEMDDQGLAGLVNNAAIAPFGPVEHTPLEAVEDTLRVNVLGPVALIRQTLPLLRGGSGRIVNVSSINGVLPGPYTAAYNASKAALESLSDSLRLELQSWDIPVVVVRPGAYDTDMRSRGVEGWRRRRQELPPDQRSLHEHGFELLNRFVAVLDRQAGHPDEIAETIHRALTEPHPETKYSIGPGMDDLLALAALPDTEREQALMQTLSSLTAETSPS